MPRFGSPFEHIKVATPCTADWDQMIGSDRMRFCAACNLNVYNLSSMSKPEAESFIAAKEGKLCVRYYCRSDGSIITADCPIGIRAFRRRVSYLVKAVAATTLSFLAGLVSRKHFQVSRLSTRL